MALASHANTQALVAKLTQIPGCYAAFDRPLFHEAVLKLNTPAAGVLHALEAQGILGGFDLMPTYPELGNALPGLRHRNQNRSRFATIRRSFGAHHGAATERAAVPDQAQDLMPRNADMGGL